MSVQDQPLFREASVARATVSSRIGAWCALWTVLAAVLGGISLALLGFAWAAPLVPLALYAAQAAASELLGVRIDAGFLSFPRRPLPAAPFLALWRGRLPVADIKEIKSRPKVFGVERIVARPYFGAELTLHFPGRAEKLAFFEAVRKQKPDISIYRGQ